MLAKLSVFQEKQQGHEELVSFPVKTVLSAFLHLWLGQTTSDAASEDQGLVDYSEKGLFFEKLGLLGLSARGRVLHLLGSQADHFGKEYLVTE